METDPSEETNERPSVPAVRLLSVKEISLLVVRPSFLASSVSAFPKVVFGAERSRVPFKAERVEWSADRKRRACLKSQITIRGLRCSVKVDRVSFSHHISFGLNLFNC